MSTTAAVQVDPASLDTSGLSVVTAPPSLTNPRAGSVYDSLVFAAGAPLWFHPMPDGVSHLMVTTRTWSAAIPAGGGLYSAYTESILPSWFVVHGATGTTTSVLGQTVTIPINTALASPLLVAAASRAPDYLYLLYSAVIAGQAGALIQLQRVAAGGVSIYVEEVVPTLAVAGGTVVFDRGLQYDIPNLNVYGTDPTGAIYQARKTWSQIGSTRRQATMTPTWEYFTGTGFSADPTQAAPLPTLTSQGPLSFAAFRNTVLASTVDKAGPLYTGRVWQSRRGRPYVDLGVNIALGSATDGSYLGGGIALQGELVSTDTGSRSSIPYLSTQLIQTPEVGANLANTWGTVGVGMAGPTTFVSTDADLAPNGSGTLSALTGTIGPSGPI